MKPDAVTLWAVLAAAMADVARGNQWALFVVVAVLALGIYREVWRPNPSEDLKKIVSQLNANTEKVLELSAELQKIQAARAFGGEP